MDHRDDHAKQWADLLDKIRHMKLAMLTTEGEEGHLHSRPMQTLETEEDGVLWFFTSRSSRKAWEINQHARVNLAYADGGKDTFISVAGEAVLVEDRRRAERLWSPVQKAWFPGGVDDPDLVLLRVDVEEAEYWDMASKKWATLAQFAKSLAGKGERGVDFPGHGTLRPPGGPIN